MKMTIQKDSNERKIKLRYEFDLTEDGELLNSFKNLRRNDINSIVNVTGETMKEKYQYVN